MTNADRDRAAMPRRRPHTAALLAASLLLLAATPCLGHRCTGDCDFSDTVSIGELIVGVRIALEQAPIFTCNSYDADLDRRVSIDELLVAVNNAFSNCGHGIATATPEPTMTSTAAETPPQATPTNTPGDVP